MFFVSILTFNINIKYHYNEKGVNTTLFREMK